MRVEDGVIQEAKFLGEGCSISLASASMMTEAVKGLKVEEALELVALFSKMMQGEEVDLDKFPLEDIEALMGVAKFPARIKCATLAWKALEQGVRNDKHETN
jgi:nitrogen fixation NifU-like protein